jgi:cytoskeletal protein RodZ
VSTILNALKKLEQEQDRSDKRAVNTRRSFQRAVRFGWIRQVGFRVLAITLVFVAVGLGLVIFFQQVRPWKRFAPLPNQSTPERSQAAAQSHDTVASRSKKPVPANPPPQDKITASTIPSLPDSGERVSASISKDQEQPPLFQEQASMRSDDTATSAVYGNVSDAPATTNGKATTALTPHRNMGKKEKKQETTRAVTENDPTIVVTERPFIHDDIPRLTDGRLKVQAIAWAPDAQDRMAVVNTHIVHEGHTVEGFLIVTIEEDAVVVREGEQSYRVAFGRP